MHAHKFLLSAGSWAEEISYPANARQLADMLENCRIVVNFLRLKTPVTLALSYQSSCLDKRPHRGGYFVEVGKSRFTDLGMQLEDYAMLCWQRAVDDYHQGLPAPCKICLQTTPKASARC